MARSRRKTPIIGIAVCDSEKPWKRGANRKLRCAVRAAMSRGDDVLPELREVSNVWTFGKDGKHYDADLESRHLRK